MRPCPPAAARSKTSAHGPSASCAKGLRGVARPHSHAGSICSSHTQSEGCQHQLKMSQRRAPRPGSSVLHTERPEHIPAGQCWMRRSIWVRQARRPCRRAPGDILCAAGRPGVGGGAACGGAVRPQKNLGPWDRLLGPISHAGALECARARRARCAREWSQLCPPKTVLYEEY